MIEGSAPAIPADPKTLKKWSRTYRVLGTLVDWARALNEGGGADLRAICKQHNISHRVLLNELKDNPEIQDEVFGSLAVEGRLVLVRSIKEAAAVLEDPQASRDLKLKWARFIAQWVGGAFEKRDTPQIAIVNLIPDRPPEVAKGRIIDARTLEDLT